MSREMRTSNDRVWTPVANPEMAAAFAGLRRSSATSPHQDRRNRRARTRRAILNRALRDE